MHTQTVTQTQAARAKRNRGKPQIAIPDLTLLVASHLLSTEEAAAHLGVTVGTLSVWRTTGRYNLPYRKVGSKVMYLAGDLRDWLDKRTKTHTGKGAQ